MLRLAIGAFQLQPRIHSHLSPHTYILYRSATAPVTVETKEVRVKEPGMDADAERAAVADRASQDYYEITGFVLPEQLCPTCESEVVNLMLGIENLEELLAKGFHECWHSLTAITVLHGAVNGDDSLRKRLHEDLESEGWGSFTDY